MFKQSNQILSRYSSPNQFLEHETFQVNNREGHLLVVSGTYYDMGLMIGRELGHLFQPNVETLYKSLKRKIALWLKKDRNLEEEIEASVASFSRFVPIESKMEMQGIYDGCRDSGHPIKDLQLLEKMNVVIELGEQECTLFAVQPPFTKGHTYQLRDLDYYKKLSMDFIPAVIIRIPQDNEGRAIDVATASFDFVAVVAGGIFTGINEYGVAFSQSRGPFLKRFSFDGTPVKYLISQILSKSKTAQEAIHVIKKYPPATSHFAIISDPLKKRESLQLVFMGPEMLHHVPHSSVPDMSVIQYDDKSRAFYEPIEGAVYWTDMEGRKVDGIPSEFNMNDLHELMSKYKHHEFDSNTGIEVAQTVGNDITFISALFDTTSNEAWVAYSERGRPAHYNEFKHFNLKNYFAYKERLVNDESTLTQHEWHAPERSQDNPTSE
ncbi:MAG TPA: hypothetical protein PK657_13835 [Legionella sp.]|nr:hypothetical protein [Legionella sp.]